MRQGWSHMSPSNDTMAAFPAPAAAASTNTGRQQSIRTSTGTWWPPVVALAALLAVGLAVFLGRRRLRAAWKTYQEDKSELLDDSEAASVRSYQRNYSVFDVLDNSESPLAISREHLVQPKSPRRTLSPRNSFLGIPGGSLVSVSAQDVRIPESPETAAEEYLIRRNSSIPSVSPCESMERFIINKEDINSSLYMGQEAEQIQDELNSHGLGRLFFSIEYDVTNMRLFVTVHRAVYLNSKRIKTGGHFYVRVTLHPPREAGQATKTRKISTGSLGGTNQKTSQKTGEVTATRNPVFEERFSFPLQECDLPRSLVTLQVKENLGSVEKKVKVGSVNFELAQYKMAQGNAASSSKVTSGAASESEKSESARLELWRDIVGADAVNKPEEQPEGEIHLSLCYESQRKKIILGILECRGLQQHDGSSLFVRVNLMSQDRVLHSKRTARITRKGTEQPEFKHTFEFPLDDLKQSASNGEDKHPLCNLFLAIYVCGTRGHRLQSKAKLLGKCILGSLQFAENEGMVHWTDMMRTPKATFYQWHSLT